MKSKILTGILLFSIAWPSFAMDVRSGRYIRGRFMFVNIVNGVATLPEPSFAIARNGSQLMVRDLINNIRYQADMSKAEEQPISHEYIEFMRNREVPGAALFIQSITVNNFVESEKKIDADFHIYLETKTIFGNVRMKATVGGRATRDECSLSMFTSNNGSSNSSQGTTPCMKVLLGTHVSVEGMSVEINGANPAWTNFVANTVGLTLDLVLKIMSYVYDDTVTMIPRM